MVTNLRRGDTPETQDGVETRRRFECTLELMHLLILLSHLLDQV